MSALARCPASILLINHTIFSACLKHVPQRTPLLVVCSFVYNTLANEHLARSTHNVTMLIARCPVNERPCSLHVHVLTAGSEQDAP